MNEWSRALGFLAGALLALLFSVGAAAARPTPPPVSPPLTAPKVLDLSERNGQIDTAQMKAADVSAVIVQASLGGRRDERAAQNVAQLRAAGIPVAALLHVYDPDDPDAPWAAQYEALAVAMRETGIRRAAVCLVDGMVPADAPDVAAFMARLVEEFPLPGNYRHLICTGAAEWQELGSPAWGAGYELWLAQETAAPAPDVPAPWKSWKLWQYTATGDGPANGVESAQVGISRFNGSSVRFEGWLTLTWVRSGRR